VTAGTGPGSSSIAEVSGYHPAAMTPSPVPPSLEVDAPRPRSRALDAVIEIATTVALAVILYVVIQTFVVQTYRVEQHSMERTLMPDQHLLIDKLTPRFDDYSRGDIIVFNPPLGGDTPFIKRVIGVAGERVAIRNGDVFVNGAKLDEPYLNPDGDTEPQGNGSSWVVGPGQLFVMGDHRAQSTDSRSFGLVDVDQVIGRAWLRFWPLDTISILQTPTYPDVPASPG
jgi:signal peptidase I